MQFCFLFSLEKLILPVKEGVRVQDLVFVR